MNIPRRSRSSRDPLRPGPALAALAFALAALLAPAAVAEEIVYFENGTSLPIRSHTVEGDMIRVDLGDNAFMAFPATQIDRIEQAGAGVIVERSTAANRVAPSPEGSFPIRGTGRRGSSGGAERPTPAATPRGDRSRIEEGDDGTTFERPFAGSAHPAKQGLRVTGSAAARAARSNPGRMNGRAAAGSNRVRLPSARARQFEQGVRPVPVALNPDRAAAGGGAQEGGASDGSSSDGGDSGGDQ